MEAYLYKDSRGNETVVVTDLGDREYIKKEMEDKFRDVSWSIHPVTTELIPIEPNSFVIIDGTCAYQKGAHDLFCDLR